MLRLSLVLLLATVLPSAALGAQPAESWKNTPLPAPPPAPAEQGQVEVGGAKLWWASYGAGDPVVLLHGGAGNSEHWSSQIVALSQKFKVYVIDSRGHGRSTLDPKQPYGYHSMATDVLAVMDKLKLEKAAFVGWSDGGIIGLDLAINNPDRVTKLVAFGANYNLAGMKSSGGAATFGTYFTKCAADYQRLSATPKDYKAFKQALSRMWNTEPNFKKEQLAKIKAPTLIADGEHDEIIRAEHVKELAKLIPGAQLAFVPKASHFALWQQPEDFNKMLLEFLSPKS